MESTTTITMTDSVTGQTTHTCVSCGTEYPSFASYTRSTCYLEAKASKWGKADDFDGTEQAEPSKHYGKTTVEQADFERPEPGFTSNQYGTFRNHAPSDKQVAFIQRLCAERALTLDPIWIATKSRCSAEIDRLMKLPVTVKTTQQPPASDKQCAFITKLLNERGVDAPDDLGTLTKAEASAMIDKLMAMPKATAGLKVNGVEAVQAAGFYYLPATDSHDVQIYKVQKAVHGSGKLYAKLLHPETGEWEYKGVRPLTAGLLKLDLETAKSLGHLYGRCMCCGATLTNEASIEAGIGPICGSRLG